VPYGIQGGSGEWRQDVSFVECPLPTAAASGRCNTPTARAIFSVLQRSTESAIRGGAFSIAFVPSVAQSFDVSDSRND
jgi:hypothetical protein